MGRMYRNIKFRFMNWRPWSSMGANFPASPPLTIFLKYWSLVSSRTPFFPKIDSHCRKLALFLLYVRSGYTRTLTPLADWHNLESDLRQSSSTALTEKRDGGMASALQYISSQPLHTLWIQERHSRWGIIFLVCNAHIDKFQVLISTVDQQWAGSVFIQRMTLRLLHSGFIHKPARYKSYHL